MATASPTRAHRAGRIASSRTTSTPRRACSVADCRCGLPTAPMRGDSTAAGAVEVRAPHVTTGESTRSAASASVSARGASAVGGPAGRLLGHPPAARLGPQARQGAVVPAHGLPGRAHKALAGSGMRPTATTLTGRSRRLRGTTAPSGPRRSPRSPTMPRRCCASSKSRPSIGCTRRPATHRVDLRLGAAADPGDQGPWLQGRGAGDGVQAAGGRPGPLARCHSSHLVALVRAGARSDKGVIGKGPGEVQQVA
jgi:hypothetical protein